MSRSAFESFIRVALYVGACVHVCLHEVEMPFETLIQLGCLGGFVDLSVCMDFCIYVWISK